MKLEKAGQNAAQKYNLRKRHQEFAKGDLVLRRNYVLSDASKYFSSKLAPRYIGPFQIKARISPWTYELSDGSIWHTKDLKPGPFDPI